MRRLRLPSVLAACILLAACGSKTTLFQNRTVTVGLQPQGEATAGYPIIATYSHLRAGSAHYTAYAFDGATYVVKSTRLVEGAGLDSLGAELRRIPTWKPRKRA